MNKPYVYTPGPTNVRENVRLARAIETTNPDLDLDFYKYYKCLCMKIAKILETKNDVFILGGEGILGLEAACASITEPGDRVLIIDNGVFGEGFKDFIKIYGGEYVLYSVDRKNPVNIEELKRYLDKDSDFKFATVVHCDTPSGVLNDISKICPLLKSYGILTVVDSVAAMIGEELKVDEWKIDIVLGGSQKAFSAPPGLTIVTISNDVYKVMDERRIPISGFYCNLGIWKNYFENKWFPYTMPVSDIYGLGVAVNNIMEEGKELVKERHHRIAQATRKSLEKYGFDLYLESGYASTVTVIEPPLGFNANSIIDHMKLKYNILIAGSFDYLKNKVIRIGHMGENANMGAITYVLNCLDLSMRDLGYVPKFNLIDEFNNEYNKY